MLRRSASNVIVTYYRDRRNSNKLPMRSEAICLTHILQRLLSECELTRRSASDAVITETFLIVTRDDVVTESHHSVNLSRRLASDTVVT